MERDATAGTLAAQTARWSLGGLLIEALARRDFEGIANCLDEVVRLRALLPFGPVEVTGRDAVAGWFRAVFGAATALELVDGTVGEVGARLYLRWRVSLSSDDAAGSRSLVEQHVFATTREQIESLDLLCSGFVPDASLYQKG